VNFYPDNQPQTISRSFGSFYHPFYISTGQRVSSTHSLPGKERMERGRETQTNALHFHSFISKYYSTSIPPVLTKYISSVLPVIKLRCREGKSLMPIYLAICLCSRHHLVSLTRFRTSIRFAKISLTASHSFKACFSPWTSSQSRSLGNEK
jgi:hypothetical protein